jgi:hypothetical protein
MAISGRYCGLVTADGSGVHFDDRAVGVIFLVPQNQLALHV